MPAGITGLRRVRRADLLDPARRLTDLRNRHLVHLAGKTPYVPLTTALPDDPEPLMDGGFTPTTTTDTLRRERRFLPGLKAGVSTPRNR
jgi:hypothetical protein